MTVYPDAEKAAIDYLLPDVPAGYTIDVRGGGGKHIRVRRVGGIEATPRHDGPMVDVMVWSEGNDDDDLARMAVAQDLWARLRAANNDPAGTAVLTYVSTFLGPRQMPDPADTTKTICMFTVTLLTRTADPA